MSLLLLYGGDDVQQIDLTGVDSSMSVGALTVTAGPVTLSLTGVDSSMVAGSITLSPQAVEISLTGIDSSAVVGDITLASGPLTLALTGIDSSMSVGTISLEVGPVDIALTGIDSSMVAGDLTITTITYLTLTGIDSSMSVGTISLDVGPVTISLIGINSSMVPGSMTLTTINYIVLAGIDSSMTPGVISLLRLAVGVTTRSVPDYRVVIAHINGAEIEEVPAKNLAYSYALNNPGGCDFVLPLEHSKSTEAILAPGQREIHIYREGELIWGGYLWTVGVSSSSETIRIGGAGFLSRLERRIIADDIIKEDVDQFDIAWSLINYTQNEPDGDLGFTRYDASDSGILRTRKYRGWARDNVFDELSDLAAVNNGFDFEILPDKRFRMHYPDIGSDNGLVFDLDKNIGSIAFDRDATQTVSELHGMGSGSGNSRCISIVTHTPTQDDYGLLQESLSFSKVRHYDALVDRTTEALRVRKGIRELPQITVTTNDPPFGSFSVGDTVGVRARKGYINMNKSFRIATQLIQVSDEGYESNQLFMNELVDA